MPDLKLTLTPPYQNAALPSPTPDADYQRKSRSGLCSESREERKKIEEIYEKKHAKTTTELR